MKKTLILLECPENGEAPRFTPLLGSENNPARFDYVLKCIQSDKSSLLDGLSFSDSVPSRQRTNSRRIIIVAIDQEVFDRHLLSDRGRRPVSVKVNEVFDSGIAFAGALGVFQSQISPEISRSKALYPKEDDLWGVGTIRGVSFMYEDDYLEKLSEHAHI